MARSPIDYTKLTQAVHRARLVLRAARQFRHEMAREAAGHRYAEGGATRPVKVNLLGLFQTVIGGSLIAQDPRYLLTGRGGVPRARVRTEQDWLNEQVVRIGLADTLRRAVTDALYGQAVVKVAVTSPCDAASGAWGVSAGEPGAWVVDFDDYVCDVNAKTPEQFTFEGHFYDCPLDVAKAMYGKKAADLEPDVTGRDFNREGDERIGRISRGFYGVEEFEDHVRLCELYLPRHRRVVTLAERDVLAYGDAAKPLWEQQWVGPPWGPYVRLGFGVVPGNALAKGPMADLYELHMDVNNVHRKINHLARNLKELVTYPRGQDEDATAVRTANSGDMVPVENPERLQPLVTCGNAIPVLTTIAALYKELFDYVSNIGVLGGRGPESPTATQDKLLNENAGAGMAVMQRAVAAFVGKVGESLLWLSHHHPELVMKSDYRPRGTGISVPRELHPLGADQHPQRDWPFSETHMRLDPYSLTHKSPEQRLQFLDGAVQQALPVMPLLSQQGIALDVNAWMQYRAEYGDAPELLELFTVRPPPAGEDEGGGGAEAPHDQTLPAQTERTYTRRNVPQDKGSQSQQLLAHMAGVGLGGAMNGTPSMNGAGS